MVLEGLNPNRWVLGLERVKKALDVLGHPERSYPHVLVAGTNGKGSTCMYLERLLGVAGLVVGTNLSPHISRFAERFRVGSVEEDPATLSSLQESLSLELAGLDLTYFEWCVVLAAELFSRKNVDAAVFEVGLGGRFDATNALDPAVAVITDVSLDHTDLLGTSTAQIALEKAHIARPSRPLVTTASGDALEVIRAHAASVGADLHVVDALPEDMLPGAMDHLRKNAAAAVEAARLLGHRPLGPALADALAGAFLPGRLEWFGDRVVLDVAHNEASVLVLVEHLAARGFSGVGVVGVLKDKDYKAIVRTLKRVCRHVYIAPVRSPRSWGAPEMEEVAAIGGITVCESVGHAFDRALLTSAPVVVTGSFYTVAEVRERLVCRGWPA